MRAVSSQAWTARTGQVASLEPKGMPRRRPLFSWSVFETRRVTISPALENSRSATSSETSSARRKAPAKPSSSTARSLRPDPRAGQFVQHPLQIGDQGGGFADLGGADGAADAGVDAMHQARGGRRGQVGAFVGLGDDHQAAGDGGRLRAAVGHGGQVQRDGLLRRGQGREPRSAQKARKSRQPEA